MNIDTLMSKIGEYASTVLVGKAKSWMAKFALGAGTEAFLGKARDFVLASGTVSSDGVVDTSRLKAIIASGFKSAGHLDLFGGLLGFDQSDVDDLFAFVEK